MVPDSRKSSAMGEKLKQIRTAKQTPKVNSITAWFYCNSNKNTKLPL